MYYGMILNTYVNHPQPISNSTVHHHITFHNLDQVRMIMQCRFPNDCFKGAFQLRHWNNAAQHAHMEADYPR